jgi:hypothetical protein
MPIIMKTSLHAVKSGYISVINRSWPLILFAAIQLMFTIPASAQRIYVDGNNFKVDGRQIWINGTNTPWNRWNEFGGNFNESFWREEFARLVIYGVNSTRVWLSCDADGHVRITEDGYVNGPTEKFWSDVDKLMEIAEEYQIYIMAAAISFDHVRQGRDVAAWKKMYGDPENRQSFVDNYIKELVTRYGDNPWFFAVDVSNEIEWVWENHDVDREDAIDLIARVANGVHENSDILVTQGMGAGPKYNSTGTDFSEGNVVSDESLSSKQPGAYLDFYKLHYYEWQDRWFSNPFDRSPEDWGIDDKPCVIGECRANGTNAGYTYPEALTRAFGLGWQGIMPWTSNPIGRLGTIYDHGPGSLAFTRAYPDLVYPVSGPQTVEVTGVGILPSETTMEVNTSLQLTAVLDPENASNQYLSWNSSDETIATVSAGGRVTAIGPGSFIIEVVTHDGGFTDQRELVAENPHIAVTGITVSPETGTVEIAETIKIDATITPSNASNHSVTWLSADTSIAVVGTDGLVTGVAEGSAIITVTTEDGGFQASAEITVTDISTGISGSPRGEAPSLEGITIAPNPAGNLTVVNVPSGITGARLVVIDMTGIVLREEILDDGENLLYLDDFKSAIYIMRITNQTDAVAIRLVVARPR